MDQLLEYPRCKLHCFNDANMLFPMKAYNVSDTCFMTEAVDTARTELVLADTSKDLMQMQSCSPFCLAGQDFINF